jgi:uncharacterized Zn-finger protein
MALPTPVNGQITDAVTQAPEAPETVEVDTTTVRCDGGGALGHPMVYLNMGEKTWVECPYCDRKFALKGG